MGDTRIKRLISTLPHDFEAALIQTRSNRFYFLDFDSDDAGTLLILPTGCYFIVDARYYESAQRHVQSAEVCLQKNLYTQLSELLTKAGVRKISIEQQISLAQFGMLKEKLEAYTLDDTKVLSEAIGHLRAVKDQEELDRIRKAQAVNDACFQHILPKIVPDVTEFELMLEMERFLRSNTAEQVAFDTIVLTGANTSLPHGRPGETKLKCGDFITMDFGAKYRGYCSDMTRTVALGEPSAEQKEVYDVVLQAQLAAVSALRSGLVCCDVDKVARDIIQKAGYGAFFGHGLGHAVGVEIHEEPRLSPLCRQVVKAGMVVTVEPGIYLQGKFGCRIEDTVVVGEEGCTVLPMIEKRLMIL